MADPNEPCAICLVPRELHGDMRHKFTLDPSDLQEKEPPKPARQTPPLSKEAQRLAKDPVAALTLRLVEKLIQRGLLEGDDLLYIFGGDYAVHRGDSGERAQENSAGTMPV